MAAAALEVTIMNVSTALIDHVRSQMPELTLRPNEAMNTHCSMRIGGRAAVLALPRTLTQLTALCDILHRSGVEPMIMGNGTNMLFGDEPIDRFIVKLGDGFDTVTQVGEHRLFAMSGVSLARLANHALSLGLRGLEFAQGIPGTLGGALSMNAGAYDGEMAQVTSRVRFIDGTGNLLVRSGDELEYGYRRSYFTGHQDCVIVGGELSLEPGEPDAISEKMRELAQRRRESQPLDMASAGSTFKRPANGYAAQLIDEAGLRGYAVGAAQVSEKHAGFLINRGGASFSDMMVLIEHVRDTVFKNSGVTLELEVKVVQ